MGRAEFKNEKDVRMARAALVEADDRLCAGGWEDLFSEVHDLISEAIDKLDAICPPESD